ncbi:MAG: ABC transporter ATP-binding protein [Proteobacteria bacterium]|nr:ABC transporter ATP-binding protein [Pseudomonadota bacterium]
MIMHLLKTVGVSRSFGKFTAVNAVDLHISATGIHALIGPNGAGKSTLLNLLAGTLPVSCGCIYYEGRDVTRLPIHARARIGISRSYQVVTLFAGLTCRQAMQLALQRDLSVAAWLSPGPMRKVRNEADEILKAMDLFDVAEADTAELSHGLQKHLEIALALANSSRLLLLDEPMAGMSISERAALAARVRELAKDRAIVLVEHDIDMVMSLADTVTVLHNGAVIASGDPAEVRANSMAQSVYLQAGMVC